MILSDHVFKKDQEKQGALYKTNKNKYMIVFFNFRILL